MRRLLPVVAFLLLHFFIRSHHILRLDPYIDEGFHITRGTFVWDFEVNPGRVSEGKFLLYYWLGVFEAEPTHSLAPARFSMALFSLISGAVIFLLGRWLVNYKTGLVAFGLYAIFPLAYFLERMAMADPFAAGLAALLAWRSLVFAKYPTRLRAAEMGILMALVTMAKLTMGLVPVLPIAASFIYWRWEKGSFISQAWAWVKRYFVPLCLAGLVLLICWSPILIPAYLTRNSDDPITLVDTYNIKTANPDEHTLGEYFWGVVPIVSEFTTKELLLVVLLAAGYWLGVGRNNARQLRNSLYVMVWLLVMCGPTLYIATIITSRYMMPLSGPMVLMLAYLMMSLWDSQFMRPMARLGVVSVAALWIIGFAYPFTRDTLNDPIKLPLTGTSLIEYLSGNISGDIAIQQAGARLDELNPRPERIYVNWSVCPLLRFYTNQALICLDRNNIVSNLSDHLANEMPDCGDAIFVVSGYPDSVLNIYGVQWELITTYQRARVNRPVKIYRATWQDKCESQ